MTGRASRCAPIGSGFAFKMSSFLYPSNPTHQFASYCSHFILFGDKRACIVYLEFLAKIEAIRQK
jgi:hypothetical protein